MIGAKITRTIGDIAVSKIVDIPVAPTVGMLVILPDAEIVIGRVALRVRDRAPGLHPPALELETLAEKPDALSGELAAGWAQPVPHAAAT